ncbi:hypothetical protein QEN19_002093 [Hanseniaspora menglaensis]
MSDENYWFDNFNGNIFSDTLREEADTIFRYSEKSRRLASYLAESNVLASRTLLDLYDIQQKNAKEYREASFILESDSSANPTITLPSNLLDLKQKRYENLNGKDQMEESSQKKKDLVLNKTDHNIHNTESLLTPSKVTDIALKKETPNNKSNIMITNDLKQINNSKDELQMSSKSYNASTHNSINNSLKHLQKYSSDISSAEHHSVETNYNKPSLPATAVIRKASISAFDSTAGGQYFKTKSNRTSQYFKPLPVRSINESQNKNRPNLYSMKEEQKQPSSIPELGETKHLLLKKQFNTGTKTHDRIKNVKESLRAGSSAQSLKTFSSIPKNPININSVKNKLLEKKIAMTSSMLNKSTTKLISSQNVFDRLTNTGTKSSINKNNSTKSSINKLSPVRANRSLINNQSKRTDVTPRKTIEIRERKTPNQNTNMFNSSSMKNEEKIGFELSFSTPKTITSASNKKLSERKNQLLNISPLRNDVLQKRQLHMKHQFSLRKSPKRIQDTMSKTHTTLKRNLQMTSTISSNQIAADKQEIFEIKENINSPNTDVAMQDDDSKFKSPAKLNSVLHDINFKDHRMRIGDTSPKVIDESLPEIKSESEIDEPESKEKKHLQPWATESALLSLIRQQQRDSHRDPFKIFGPIDDVAMLDNILQ